MWLMDIGTFLLNFYWRKTAVLCRSIDYEALSPSKRWHDLLITLWC